MGTKKRISKRAWIILIVVLVTQILFDPLSSILNLSENTQARVGLPLARRKWDTQKITHYKFDAGATSGACIWQASIEVKNGVVIDMGRVSDFDVRGFSMPPPSISTPASQGSFFMCDHRNFTMPRLFDELERSLLERPSSTTRISFDPEYGFVSGVRFGSPGGWGLLHKRIVFIHCCSGFYIRNFQVLDE